MYIKSNILSSYAHIITLLFNTIVWYFDPVIDISRYYEIFDISITEYSLVDDCEIFQV